MKDMKHFTSEKCGEKPFNFDALKEHALADHKVDLSNPEKIVMVGTHLY